MPAVKMEGLGTSFVSEKRRKMMEVGILNAGEREWFKASKDSCDSRQTQKTARYPPLPSGRGLGGLVMDRSGKIHCP